MIAAERRIAANLLPPPADAPIRACAACPPQTCRSTAVLFLDYDLGRDAHEVVFGHQPERAKVAEAAR